MITLKKWDKLLFLSYSPAIRAKDLLFGSDNVKYWCFVRCPFRFTSTSLPLRYNCFGHYLMKLHYMDTLKSLLTMIQQMHCLLVFCKMSFPFHFIFSPLACKFFLLAFWWNYTLTAFYPMVLHLMFDEFLSRKKTILTSTVISCSSLF